MNVVIIYLKNDWAIYKKNHNHKVQQALSFDLNAFQKNHNKNNLFFFRISIDTFKVLKIFL